MTKKITIKVDSAGCIACGACVAITSAGGNFKFIDDKNSPFYGKSTAHKQPENDQETRDCIDASEACPVNVIHIEEIK